MVRLELGFRVSLKVKGQLTLRSLSHSSCLLPVVDTPRFFSSVLSSATLRSVMSVSLSFMYIRNYDIVVSNLKFNPKEKKN